VRNHKVMNSGKYVFTQVLSLVNSYEFSKCVKRYNGNYRTRGLNCWNQFAQLFFGQLTGKARGHYHIWPDYTDHHNVELSACCLVMYVNCILTGQMWSISPAFAVNYLNKPYFKSSLIFYC
jgi:hypothetical protein